MITVYAIKSLTRNYIYVGMTDDLTRRLNEHNNGENFPDRITARGKEKYLKSGIGKEFLKSLTR